MRKFLLLASLVGFVACSDSKKAEGQEGQTTTTEEACPAEAAPAPVAAEPAAPVAEPVVAAAEPVVESADQKK